MPGKVNPVIPEAVSQVVAQVYGNDAAVAFAGSQGNFELYVYLPVMALNLLESIRLLSNVSRLFADRFIAGIEADVVRCRPYAQATPQAATALPIGRAHVCTPVTNETLVYRLLLEKKQSHSKNI